MFSRIFSFCFIFLFLLFLFQKLDLMYFHTGIFLYELHPIFVAFCFFIVVIVSAIIESVLALSVIVLIIASIVYFIQRLV